MRVRLPIAPVLTGLTLLGCASTARTPAPDSACVDAPPGLVSWWPGGSSARDIVGSNDGEMSGGVTAVDGFIASGDGLAFRFDGVDALVRVPHAPDLDPSLTSSFTVTARARPAIRARNGTVVGKGHPYEEQFIIDQLYGRWRGVARTEDGRALRLFGPPVDTTSFTHLALSWDGSTMRLFVNGTEVEAGRLPNIARSRAFLGIGGRSEAGYGDRELELEFTGVIDEVMYFDRPLTRDEMWSFIEARRAGVCSP